MTLSGSPVTAKLTSLLALVFIFLFPLIVLPTTPNFFETNKLAFTVVIASLTTIVWAAHIITQKKLEITLTPFTLPLLTLGLVYLISSFFAAANTPDALAGRGIFIPALIILSFIVTNVVKNKRFIHQALYALIASATLLSFVSIFQSLGFGLSGLINRLAGTQLPDTLAFTPAGSPIALISFLTPIAAIALILAFTKKDMLEKVVLFLLSAVIAAGLVLVIAYSLPGKDTAPVFLPHRYGYAIALETLKDTGTALLGYGPEQFPNAYNRNRQATINTTDFWNVRFTASSNELFHTITVTGFLGLAAFLWLAVSGSKALRSGQSTLLDRLFKVIAVALFLLMLLIPATYLHLFTFIMLLSLWSIYLKASHDRAAKVLDLNLDSIRFVRAGSEAAERQPVPILPFAVAIPAILISLGMLYYTGRAYYAETIFKRSLDAATQNDGVATYDLQRQAILTNPYSSRYHRAYSATNLALANSIAGKEELTDEDRANISQLIQQSIREAKAAVALDPANSQNWENLTFVYRSLINVAQNADSWTVASLAQAIQNDPVNPRLRLELGGIYYALQRYDQAIRLYQQAAELKPDWANAYYNLSAAHQQKSEFAQAFDYMRQVLRLVPQDSADYARAQEELEALAEKLNVPQAEQVPPPTGELEAADAPIPTPNPEGAQVELPEESGPQGLSNQTPEDLTPTEGADIEPTPEPTPAPTAQP
jgi:tetratricopeptide (TPR) repeat protein